jgi:DNA-binding transcriptional LysR family regulator
MDTIDSIDLRSLRLFEAVARHQSFAEAGRELGMPRAVASKVIADLEATLGGKLFRRTTRRVGLTELGESLLASSADTVARLRDTLHQARSGLKEVAGVVRLSVSHGFGRQYVLPLLHEFQQRNPGVQIDVLLSDAIDDLILKTLDFSIRLGPLPESSVVARRLADLEVVLVGTAKLIARSPGTKRLEDLAALPMVGFRVPGSGALVPWHFTKDGTRSIVDNAAAAIVVNSIEGVADLVKAGAGIAPLPRYLVDDEIAKGELRHLFPAHRFGAIPVHICFADRNMMPIRVRLLIDAITEGVARSTD